MTDCFIAGYSGLHPNSEGLTVVAGSSDPQSPCLRLTRVKARKAKPLAMLGGGEVGPARCSVVAGETLLTGGEDGVVRAWREGEQQVPPVEKLNLVDRDKKSKPRDKPY